MSKQLSLRTKYALWHEGLKDKRAIRKAFTAEGESFMKRANIGVKAMGEIAAYLDITLSPKPRHSQKTIDQAIGILERSGYKVTKL